MARRSASKADRTDYASFDQAGAQVIDTPLVDEISAAMVEYAYSVILSRALPDARDGLKPVHRRILYAAEQNGFRPDREHVKSARIVAEAMGNYHPHGDSSIYEAMVRMAQPFEMNVPLIDGQGNWGTPDDPAAAMRYSEARLSRAAMLLVGDLNENTVDFQPNYDSKTTEPVVLPAGFPVLLVNGTSGIAVGMATNMIPHNMGEILAAARWLVHHPNASLDKLMEFVPGPDLPTGGMLLGLDEVRRAYETGNGSVRIRARAEIAPSPDGRGKQEIIFTELPYGVGAESIRAEIQEEIRGREIKAGKQKGQRLSPRLHGISDLVDLSDRDNGTRLVVVVKSGFNPQALLADLYRYTPLEKAFGINNNCIIDGAPKVVGLKELLDVFLAHRYDVVLRRSRYRRDEAAKRAHTLEGYLKVLLDIDKAIRIIRGADTVEDARDGLMKTFKLDEAQAVSILDMQLRRLTKLSRIEIENQHARLMAEIAELDAILNDDSVLKKVVAAELDAIAKEFATPRKTTLIDGDLKEVLAASAPAGPLQVADDPCQVVLSVTGLLARTAAESEEVAEGRARRGRAKHDAIAAVAHSTARGQVLLITSKGRAIKTDVLPLPVLPQQAGTVSLRGMVSASEIAGLEKGEKVIALAPTGEQVSASPGLALGTKRGVVKVAKPEWGTRSIRDDSFVVIGLDAGDEVVGATWLTDGEETLAFISSDASLLRFAAAGVRPQGLPAGGMAGIKLAADAEAVFFGAVKTNDAAHGEPMVVTSTGPGVKVTPFAEYPVKGRATGGVRAMRFLKTRGDGAGEDRLAVAWIGPRPAAVTSNGDPVELPAPDNRRDGSGESMFGPDLVGHLIERN